MGLWEVDAQEDALVEDEGGAGDVEVKGGTQVYVAVAVDAGIEVCAVVEPGLIERFSLVEVGTEGNVGGELASSGIERVFEAEPSPFGHGLYPCSERGLPVIPVGSVALESEERPSAHYKAVKGGAPLHVYADIWVDNEVVDYVLVGRSVFL